MKKVGIDLGNSSIQYIVLDENNKIIEKRSVMHHHKIRECLIDLIDIKEEVKLGITGSLADMLNLKEAYYTDSEVLLDSLDTVNSIISLGAQKTYYIEKGPNGAKVYKNNNCSSGTGSFFEEQAGRLGIELEEISKEISKATKIPHIAGRCSVFSKTDIIHHMQEGTSTPDLLNGLAYAMVRNFRMSVVKEAHLFTPVLLCGGVMKNKGVVQAIIDLFHLQEQDYILQDDFEYIEAINAAKRASFKIDGKTLREKILDTKETNDTSKLPPLFMYASIYPVEYTIHPLEKGKYRLGIDIGSTSINLVLINERKEVCYISYVRNEGKPYQIVQREMEIMKKKMDDTMEIISISVTGSGREYIAQKINATTVINEISAQCKGSLYSDSSIDTIFEIGGQDSKYMSIKDQKMHDFEMNKVCAAGTGAFLEEMIRKLGVSMSEFMELAMQSKHPVELGSRCTVFIESSISLAMARGEKMEDICAGLAYAIASNYLYRVVNSKAIGEHIAMQGGIAFNRPVVAAFQALTQKKIHVSDYFSVTGALGAALLAAKKTDLVFDHKNNQRLNKQLRENTLQGYLKDYTKPDGKKKIIGIPRAIFLYKMFPLFRGMFTKLGYDVLLSPVTDESIVALSQKYCIAETCYPIKLIYGHIAWLLEQGVDYIILPRMHTIRHKGSKARKDYACMYMQTSPLIMKQAFHFKERGVTLLSPALSLNLGKKFMINSILSMADSLKIPKPKMIPAVLSGLKEFMNYSDTLEALGKEYMEGDEPTFVIVTRTYNVADPILNMGIEEHLDKMGCRVIRLEHLEASYMKVQHVHEDLCWPFGQHILTGLNIIQKHPNFYPIYITNHGCGPDTAIQHFLKNELNGREYLHLEVDEHSSKVGIITRIEAFLYSLEKQKIKEEKEKEEIEYEVTLIPDLGIYTKIIKDRVKGKVEVIPSLQEHHNFNYALNKEYYSLLVCMEELLDHVSLNTKYRLLYPINEGSEVDHQYGHLLEEELCNRGYKVKLESFYLEDLINREDYLSLFKEMMDIETKQKGEIMVIGEPYAIYKPSICDAGLKEWKQDYVRMPLSEALIFEYMQSYTRIDSKRLNELITLHDQYSNSIYSNLYDLKEAIEGKLDIGIGNFIRYRLSKILCAKNKGVILMHSAEENSAIILNLLIEAYSKDIHIPYISFDLDHEHPIKEEDLKLFEYYLKKSAD